MSPVETGSVATRRVAGNAAVFSAARPWNPSDLVPGFESLGQPSVLQGKALMCAAASIMWMEPPVGAHLRGGAVDVGAVLEGAFDLGAACFGLGLGGDRLGLLLVGRVEPQDLPAVGWLTAGLFAFWTASLYLLVLLS